MTRPTQARISRTALRSNIAAIRRRVGPEVRVMGIAKADCYGHSAEICVPEMLACGIDIYGVATVQEAIALQPLTQGHPVVVLPPPLDGEFGLFAAHGIEGVLSTPRMAEHMAAAARSAGRTIPVHLFVDTGMGRNGVRSEDAVELARTIARLEGLELVGIASHFATSDEPAEPFTRQQLEIFDSVLRRALDAGFTFRDIHIANSGGILNFPGSHYTMVRPGLSLYGFHPTPELQDDSDLTPVLAFRTIIGNISQMEAGVSVSYGRRYFTRAQTSIATLPLGYADGVMRALTNKMSVLVRGRRYPVVGTICMDEVMVDLGNDSDVQIGDDVIIMGSMGDERIEGWELARLAGTIPYEICTAISKRVPRVALP